MKSVDSIPNISEKAVLVRGDLDVAMEDGRIVEDYRLEALVPTLEYLLKHECSVTLVGHIGRPEGEDMSLSLLPIVKRLSELLDRDIPFIQNWREGTDIVLEELGIGKIVALENLRFDSRESENNQDLSLYLSSFGEVFVNESFATAHREQASTVGITTELPAYAGLRFVQEVTELKKIREHPARPLVMIMGGGKTDTKVPIVTNMSKYADHILVGGKLMFSTELEGVTGVRFPNDAIGIKDIGPKSVELFTTYIAKAATIVWNGPMGVFEESEYENGTRGVAEAIINTGARKILGGGDTIAAMNQFGLIEEFDFVSTGGGAMLEYLAEGTLVGIEALE